MAEHPKTVTVIAVKFHTLHGAAHNAGDVYAVDATDVDNLVAQGLAAYHDAPVPHGKAKK